LDSAHAVGTSQVCVACFHQSAQICPYKLSLSHSKSFGSLASSVNALSFAVVKAFDPDFSSFHGPVLRSSTLQSSHSSFASRLIFYVDPPPLQPMPSLTHAIDHSTAQVSAFHCTHPSVSCSN
jgi:hypothetical protein